MIRRLTAILVLTGSAIALAQEKPPAAPTRDAVIGYHLAPAAGESIDVRVAIRAGQNAIRMDLPDNTYVLVQPADHAVTMVVPLQRTIVDLPWAAGPQTLFTVPDSVRFTRKGEATIAGQRCTQWDVADKSRTSLCVAADGLVLRNQSQDANGHRNLVEAFIVQYGSSPSSDFQVPADFENLTGGPK